MKRFLLLTMFLGGCMTPAQQEELKNLDADIEHARAELRELETAQKAIDHYRAEVKTLTSEVEALRSEVTRLETSKGKPGKSPVLLR